jgi:hypothetical protein
MGWTSVDLLEYLIDYDPPKKINAGLELCSFKDLLRPDTRMLN